MGAVAHSTLQDHLRSRGRDRHFGLLSVEPWFGQIIHAPKHVEALHVQKVRNVDEDPILRELAAFLMVEINNPHVSDIWASGHAHVAAGVDHRQVGPTEEAVEAPLRLCPLSYEVLSFASASFPQLR